MINYLSPFCENLTTVIQPPRVLTQEAVPYLWSVTQDSAFNKAKELISSSPVLAYYDLNKPVILQTDATDYALGSKTYSSDPNSKGREITLRTAGVV